MPPPALLLLLTATAALADRPVYPPPYIVEQRHVPPVGARPYSSYFRSSDGIQVALDGSAEGDDGASVTGSFSYTQADGTIAELSYIADKYGYRPSSSLLPVGPPIPAHSLLQIQRAAQERLDRGSSEEASLSQSYSRVRATTRRPYVRPTTRRPYVHPTTRRAYLPPTTTTRQPYRRPTTPRRTYTRPAPTHRRTYLPPTTTSTTTPEPASTPGSSIYFAPLPEVVARAEVTSGTLVQVVSAEILPTTDGPAVVDNIVSAEVSTTEPPLVVEEPLEVVAASIEAEQTVQITEAQPAVLHSAPAVSAEVQVEPVEPTETHVTSVEIISPVESLPVSSELQPEPVNDAPLAFQVLPGSQEAQVLSVATEAPASLEQQEVAIARTPLSELMNNFFMRTAAAQAARLSAAVGVELPSIEVLDTTETALVELAPVEQVAVLSQAPDEVLTVELDAQEPVASELDDTKARLSSDEVLEVTGSVSALNETSASVDSLTTEAAPSADLIEVQSIGTKQADLVVQDDLVGIALPTPSPASIEVVLATDEQTVTQTFSAALDAELLTETSSATPKALPAVVDIGLPLPAAPLSARTVFEAAPAQVLSAEVSTEPATVEAAPVLISSAEVTVEPAVEASPTLVLSIEAANDSVDETATAPVSSAEISTKPVVEAKTAPILLAEVVIEPEIEAEVDIKATPSVEAAPTLIQSAEVAAEAAPRQVLPGVDITETVLPAELPAQLAPLETATAPVPVFEKTLSAEVAASGVTLPAQSVPQSAAAPITTSAAISAEINVSEVTVPGQSVQLVAAPAPANLISAEIAGTEVSSPAQSVPELVAEPAPGKALSAEVAAAEVSQPAQAVPKSSAGPVLGALSAEVATPRVTLPAPSVPESAAVPEPIKALPAENAAGLVPAQPNSQEASAPAQTVPAQGTVATGAEAAPAPELAADVSPEVVPASPLVAETPLEITSAPSQPAQPTITTATAGAPQLTLGRALLPLSQHQQATFPESGLSLVFRVVPGSREILAAGSTTPFRRIHSLEDDRSDLFSRERSNRI